MKKASLIFLFFSLAALCGESRSFKVAGQPKLDLNNLSGDCKIVAGKAGQVEVNWVSENDLIEVIVEQKGDRISVRSEFPKNVRTIRGGVNFEIRFPADGDLEVETVSSNISVDGVGGKISLQTVSGDVTLTDSAGELELQSVSGNIELSQIGVAELSAQVVSGTIKYQGSLEGGDYAFNTTSGSITLEVEPNASFEITGQAMSGNVSSKFSGISVAKEQYTGFKSLEGSVNGGKAKVEVATVSGGITIK